MEHCEGLFCRSLPDRPCYRTRVLSTLFLFSFLAATFLPFSSEASLAMALGAGCPAAAALAVATAGNTLGSLVTFLIGRSGRRILERPERLEAGASWLARGGDLAVLLSWMPVIGDAIPLAAGALAYPMARFVVLSAVGRFARYSLLVLGFSTL